ncbi:MAG: hypothetical protein HYV26_10915, partial [Candidatus Hydrogenedentes bacterium]|nr:hypothetical protein [Candidatus Hydrogenedentota bacterium]
ADLIRFLTGKEIVQIGAFTARLEKEGDVEDNFSACIQFEDGSIGMLGASWTAKGLGSNFLIFHCSNGSLRVHLWPNQPCVAHVVNPKAEIVFETPEPLGQYPGSWGVDVGGAFARAVLGLEKPFCTGEEAMRSLAVILAAEEAAKTARSVKVKF